MAFKKPSDYESVTIGEYRILPAGGYICRIIKAEETKSKAGRDMLKIAFDICDGGFSGYFMDQFQSRKAAAEDPKEVKWPFSGTKWVMIFDNEGGTNRDFKALCTALKDSGTEVWDKNDNFLTGNLKDAEVGIIFRREEHEYMNQTSWRTVPFRFRSVKSIEAGDFNVPEDKPMPSAYPGAGMAPMENDSFSALDDDIPF